MTASAFTVPQTPPPTTDADPRETLRRVWLRSLHCLAAHLEHCARCRFPAVAPCATGRQLRATNDADWFAFTATDAVVGAL